MAQGGGEDVQERASGALAALDDLAERLAKVHEQGVDWERLKRWEDRAQRVLSEHFGTEEVDRFNRVEGSMVMGDPEYNFVFERLGRQSRTTRRPSYPAQFLPPQNRHHQPPRPRFLGRPGFSWFMDTTR